MNYKERLKQEQFDVDPEAWQAFQRIRQAAPAAPVATPKRASKQRLLWLLLLLLFLLGLGWSLTTTQWITPAIGVVQNTSETQPLKRVQQHSQKTTSTVAANTKAPQDELSPLISKANPTKRPTAKSAVTGTEATTEKEPASTTRSLMLSTDLSNTTAQLAMESHPEDSENTAVPVQINSASPTEEKATGRLTNITELLEKITIAPLTYPAASVKLPEETAGKKLRPARWELRANFGRGITNYSNPFQGIAGFERSRIAGPYGQLRLLRPMNRFIALGLAASYYTGEDRINHFDGQKESDERLALMLQLQFKLVNRGRFSTDLIFGGGYEHSNFTFASLEGDLGGGFTRVLTPRTENRGTFEIQISGSYQLNARSNIGAFFNTHSSNNGFYGYGLSYKTKF